MKEVKAEKHKHDWEVIDYVDYDPGILIVECRICKKDGRAVTTKEELKEYQRIYVGGYPELMYLPKLADDYDKLLDTEAITKPLNNLITK